MTRRHPPLLRRAPARRAALPLVVALLATANACGSAGPDDATPTSASPTTTTPIAAVDVPPPPTVPRFQGDAAAQAAAYITALADPAADRPAVVLAGFAAAGLPVIAEDGTSLTTPTAAGTVGLPWAVVWATAGSSGRQGGVSLAGAGSLLALMDPLGADADVVTGQLLDGLRTALSTDDGADGPGFVAHVVAAAAAADGLDLADPSVSADQVTVPHPVVTLLLAGFLHAALTTLQGQADAPDDTAPSGGFRAVQAPAPPAGCDGNDGMDGWLLWTISKVMTGAAMPGLPQWGGLYEAVVTAAVQRGYLVPQALDVTSVGGKAAGIAGALVNLLLFAAQAGSTTATGWMDGSGPLVRTKTTTHGSARTVTIQVSTTADATADEIADQNCMLAIASLLGNNSLRAFGDAANVEIEVSGGAGFANSLAAGNSIVLFGPAQFQPVQTADEHGQITVPVQGRAQRHPVPETALPVERQFSVMVEASLDPITATTIGKQLADSALCMGTLLGGGGGMDVATSCTDAVLNAVKQWHWDLGELVFPLTDWEHGWVIDETISRGGYPFTITGVSCYGPYGPWQLSLYATPPGLTMTGELDVTFDVIDDISGAGEVDIHWHAQHEQGFADSAGTVQARLEYQGDQQWVVRFVPGSYQTTVVTPSGVVDSPNMMDSFELPVRPAAEGECDADG